MLISFIFSCGTAIANIERWKFEISIETCFVIIVGMCIIVLTNAIIHYYYSNKKILIFNRDDSPLNLSICFIFLIIMLVAVDIQVNFVKSIANTTESFSNMMNEYRMKVSYGFGEIGTPGYLSQLDHFTKAICYICVFNVIVFYKKISKPLLAINLLIIVTWCIKILLNASRFEIFTLLFGAIFIFNIERIRINKGYKKVKIILLIKTLAILGIAIYLFYAVAHLVGRKSDSSLLEYLSSYIGTNIPNFNLFLNDPIINSKAFPNETFFGILQWLRRWGFDNIQGMLMHKEFRESNGYSLGNTYTAFRDYYHDFGICGLIFLHTIYSILFSYMYEKCKRKINNSRIIIISTIYGSVPMYVFSNAFFGLYLSPTYCTFLFELFLLYLFFIHKKK